MFTLIDDEKANFNGRVLSTCGLDEAGNRIAECVEAASRRDAGYDELLFIRDLRGITPSQFPEQFRVSIWGVVEAGFQYASEVVFRRNGSEVEFEYTFDIRHQEWEHPSNLKHFLDQFCDVLRTELEHVQSVSQEHMEGLTFVNVGVGMQLTDDCATTFHEVDRRVLKLFRQTLSNQPKDVGAVSASGGDAGYKWWVRYVLVPLICSGGFAALIALAFHRAP